MRKTFLIIINIVTGLIVTALTIFAYGISGMAEAPQPLSSYYWLLLLVVWLVGVVLQLKLATRVIGLIITFVPIIYILFLFVLDSL